MKLHEIKSKNIKSKKRLGRGNAAGGGTTAGRGTKGEKARSGFNIPNRFEGGQSPLIQRLPKTRGFKSTKLKPQEVTLFNIEKKYKESETVNPSTLYKKELIKNKNNSVKIIGDLKDLKKNLKFSGCSMSKKIQEKFGKKTSK